MTLHTYDHLLEAQRAGQTTVIRFKRRTILDSMAIEAVGEHLLQLAGDDEHRAFVLNFAGVESLTSAMLGKFVALHRVLNESGGRLAFCCVDPFLMEVFKIVQIPERIPIYPDEAQALQALSAE
jgi:anti-anti-sigma factor